MSIPVSFPGLGLEFNISRVAFAIGDFNIYWYGLVIGLGMLLALAMAFSQSTRFGIDPDRMIDVVIIGFVLGIVGARLYYVVFSEETYETFFDLINLRGGGLAIYGGVIGAFLGALIGCKWRKVPVAPMLDLTAMGFLIGQAFGRWGNFFNQEAFGTNTNLPWGMLSPATTAYLSQPEVKELLTRAGSTVSPELPVHPTFLYESLWCALGFVLLFLFRKKRRFNGEIALMYVMWYGLERAVVEGLRTDPLMLGTLRVSQVLAILSVLAAVVIWVIARGKTKGIALRVPEIPPRGAKVKLALADGGKQTVVVQWPYNMKAPDKAQQQKLAQAALDALGDEKPDGPIAVMVDEAAVEKAGEIGKAEEAASEAGEKAADAEEAAEKARKAAEVAGDEAEEAKKDAEAAEEKVERTKATAAKELADSVQTKKASGARKAADADKAEAAEKAAEPAEDKPDDKAPAGQAQAPGAEDGADAQDEPADPAGEA